MKSEDMNNKEAIENKKAPMSINPNINILKREGSNSSSGNLPTPMRALSTSLIKTSKSSVTLLHPSSPYKLIG